MGVLLHGRVEDGRVILSDRVALPDGTDVLVSIEPLNEGETDPGTLDDDMSTWPQFGMWADRPEMRDSVAWVRSQRAQWRRRLRPED